ncbi:hypothetical protein CKO28_18540 [Rhodovibrio sodomensis]|uniref:Uncharacterized protein n=1 Tax=Rhodovibrio sodomensis TaxID=1088 RepID=A0ABS1DHT7_9PROT|nr:hypothetical protein [Rhodovibrio sodomensis]MBK1670036.1 hypothetical protein [Rhodovibrio sodomensis]
MQDENETPMNRDTDPNTTTAGEAETGETVRRDAEAVANAVAPNVDDEAARRLNEIMSIEADKIEQSGRSSGDGSDAVREDNDGPVGDFEQDEELEVMSVSAEGEFDYDQPGEGEALSDLESDLAAGSIDAPIDVSGYVGTDPVGEPNPQVAESKHSDHECQGVIAHLRANSDETVFREPSEDDNEAELPPLDVSEDQKVRLAALAASNGLTSDRAAVEHLLNHVETVENFRSILTHQVDQTHEISSSLQQLLFELLGAVDRVEKKSDYALEAIREMAADGDPVS